MERILVITSEVVSQNYHMVIRYIFPTPQLMVGFLQLLPDSQLEDGVRRGRGGKGLHHHLSRHERHGVSLLHGHLLRHAQGTEGHICQ